MRKPTKLSEASRWMLGLEKKGQPNLQIEQSGIGTRIKKLDNQILRLSPKPSLTKQKAHFQFGNGLYRREDGIRTHDNLLGYTHFPGVLLRPLGHLSEWGCKDKAFYGFMARLSGQTYLRPLNSLPVAMQLIHN
jgi:hypothetical protein